MSKYKFTDDMKQISGFGGTYEQSCRTMLKAGLQWLDDHPEAKPKFSQYENVYGLVNDENEDAESMSKAIVESVDRDCTGAMHHAVISHCLFIAKHGWDEYVEKMTPNPDPYE